MRYAVAVLLCNDLLETCVSGQGILKRKLRLALNERQNVVDELVLEAVLSQGEPELPLENSLPRYARLKKVIAK